MNINSEPLVNVQRVLWKTQSESKIIWYEKLGIQSRRTKCESQAGGERENLRKTRMRPRPATGTASFVSSCSRRLSPRSGAMTAPTLQPSEELLRRSKPIAKPQACAHESATAAGRQRPFLLQRAVGGLRPQRPGCQSRKARFWKFYPSATSLSLAAGCHWLCRNHPAKSGTITFRCNHCYPVWCAGQQKIPPRLCRTCGRCDFPVEAGGKLRANISHEFHPYHFNYLHNVKVSLSHLRDRGAAEGAGRSGSPEFRLTPAGHRLP